MTNERRKWIEQLRADVEALEADNERRRQHLRSAPRRRDDEAIRDNFTAAGREVEEPADEQPSAAEANAAAWQAWIERLVDERISAAVQAEREAWREAIKLTAAETAGLGDAIIAAIDATEQRTRSLVEQAVSAKAIELSALRQSLSELRRLVEDGPRVVDGEAVRTIRRVN